MFQTKLSLSIAQWLRVFFSLALTLILFIGYPSEALAQEKNFIETFIEQVKSFVQPRKALATTKTRNKSAAGRGRCPVLLPLNKYELPLTALIPTLSYSQTKEQLLQKTSSNQIVWSTTAAEYPTFWFYIPYSYNDSGLKYAKFALLDQNNHSVFDPILIEFPKDEKTKENKPSIAQFTLPNQVRGGLNIGKEYKWYFSIICDARKPSKNPSVSGLIQRVKSPFPIEISQAALRQNGYKYYAQTYAKAGIWHETVTFIADSTIQQIQSPREEWVSLIEFIFKDEIQKTKENTQEKQSAKNQIANDIANSPMIKLVPAQNQEELEDEPW